MKSLLARIKEQLVARNINPKIAAWTAGGVGAAVLIAIIIVSLAGGDSTAAAETTTTTVPLTTTTSTTTTSTTTTTTTTTIPEPEGTPSPLNGLRVPDEALDTLDRRVIAVKIDNHEKARPQSGLQEADAVYEVQVEFGITRFLALFHQSDSAYLGPIRSARPTDPTLLKYLGASFQISGAQPWVLDLVSAIGVRMLGEGATTFRIDSRRAPENLYGATELMRQEADARQHNNEPPPAIFTFDEEASETTEVANVITLKWSENWPDVRWEWDGERYIRFNGSSPHWWISIDGEQDQVAADTLVVLHVAEYTATPPSGVSGQSVPAVDTVGVGQAFVFFDGGVIVGEWSRGSVDQRFELTSDGEPIVLPPGVPWISVFPDGRTIEWSE